MATTTSSVQMVMMMVMMVVGVEKVGTNQLIFMRCVWQCEMFSSIV
jgi:hypothetical protein